MTDSNQRSRAEDSRSQEPASHVAGRVLRGFLLLAGLASVLLGATADLLRSSGDPGLGSAQIGLMLIGTALLLSTYALGSEPAQGVIQSITQNAWKTALSAVASLLAIALTLEAALATRGARPLYSPGSEVELSLARWWACDRLGCRFDPQHTRDAPSPVPQTAREFAAEIFFERLRVVNSQGFHDDEEFVPSPALRRSFKILVLGDSHAFGFYARLGRSWVELLASNLESAGDVTVWNTGIPGAATVQELQIFRHFAPIMEPDLVILGFYPGNDLDGNLHPADNFYALDSGMLFLKHRIGPGFEPIAMTPAEAYYRATGRRLSSQAGAVETQLGRTRTGTLWLRTWARLLPGVEWLWSPEARWAPGPELKQREAESRTARLLGEIEDLVNQRGSRLVLLLIPGPGDLVAAGPRYRKGKRIAEGGSMEVIELVDHLDPEDYLPGDEHWNSSGHAKAARRLAEYVQPLLP